MDILEEKIRKQLKGLVYWECMNEEQNETEFNLLVENILKTVYDWHANDAECINCISGKN